MARRILNQALTRPETVAGAEKGPLGYVVAPGVFFAMCAWTFWAPVPLIASAVLLFGGVPLLREIAKADPEMFAVYRANQRFKQRYSARGSARLGGK